MKLVISLLLFIASLQALEMNTKYHINVGMFGQVAYADISLIEENGEYEAKVLAKAVGTAATLTGEREESYYSKGKIINGEYIPTEFTRKKQSNRKSQTQHYTFDHLNKSITLKVDKMKWINKTEVDPVAFKMKRVDKQVFTTDETVLKTYYKDDVLSAYLNAKNRCTAEAPKYPLNAIGAKNHKNDVIVSYRDKNESDEKRFSPETSKMYNLHIKPKDEDETTVDILIAFDKDGYLKEAILGDIFWIGEVKAERVFCNISDVK